MDNKQPVILVKLNEDQIKRAKEANGPRLRITHALLCGKYGQIFGTENQCRKYYNSWGPRKLFPHILGDAYETDDQSISNYETTDELVTVLIKANDPIERKMQFEKIGIDYDKWAENGEIKTKKRSLLSRIFGKK
ncbi:hypothetical protein [Sessilibacter corallicola]|uniref:hypothetical protein n=1 Tax=Sessilibacter corallicola TaxID=2904075 RepID=UPI001E54725D|nr:hypothetical protein [Sessilibacter corallicola]MCE2029296.1 hypothetical protein [Sessilibacter corallicola]